MPVTMGTGSGGTISMLLPVPFVHQPSWAFDRGGWFWVEPGNGYRRVALSPEHDTLSVVERSYDPVPVTEAEVQEALEQFSTGPLEESGTEVELGSLIVHEITDDAVYGVLQGELEEPHVLRLAFVKEG